MVITLLEEESIGLDSVSGLWTLLYFILFFAVMLWLCMHKISLSHRRQPKLDSNCVSPHSKAIAMTTKP